MSEHNTKSTTTPPDSLLNSDVLAQVLGPDAMRMLRCGICMEFFDIPIVLPCGHTFCLHCLTEMCRHAGLSHAPIGHHAPLAGSKDVRVACPNCRVLIYASPILERNVTCNFIIQSLLESLRTRRKNKSTTKSVNTDELRLTGRARALSDLEVNHVTGQIDRLLTALDHKSVLDAACLEVEEIRLQHLKTEDEKSLQVAPGIGLSTQQKNDTKEHQQVSNVPENQALRLTNGDDRSFPPKTKDIFPAFSNPQTPVPLRTFVVLTPPNPLQQQQQRNRYVPPQQRICNTDQHQPFRFQVPPPALNLQPHQQQHQQNQQEQQQYKQQYKQQQQHQQQQHKQQQQQRQHNIQQHMLQQNQHNPQPQLAQQHQQRKLKKQPFPFPQAIGSKTKTINVLPIKKDNQFQLTTSPSPHISNVSRILSQSAQIFAQKLPLQSTLDSSTRENKDSQIPGGFNKYTSTSIWHSHSVIGGSTTSLDPSAFRCPTTSKCPPIIMGPPTAICPSTTIFPSNVFPSLSVCPPPSVSLSAASAPFSVSCLPTSTASTPIVTSAASGLSGSSLTSSTITPATSSGPSTSGQSQQKLNNDPAVMSYSFAASAKPGTHK